MLPLNAGFGMVLLPWEPLGTHWSVMKFTATSSRNQPPGLDDADSDRCTL